MSAEPLQAILDRAVTAGAPSALLRIQTPDWHWAGAAGDSAPGMPFRAASVTKMVTATTVMALAERRLIDLDRPVGEVGASPRQLIGHTAGLPDYFHSPRLLERIDSDPDTAFEPADLLRLAAEVDPPAGDFAYSDTGYVVAGLHIQATTGKPLHDVYRELIFDPLGMDATYLEGREPARGPSPARHFWGDRDMSAVTPTFDWAGGGLVTTTADLVTFVRGLHAGSVIGPASLAQMMSWNPAARFDPAGGPQYERYGLGIGSNTVAGVTLVGHTGFWGSFAYWSPAHGAAIAGTVNATTADRAPVVEMACRALSD